MAFTTTELNNWIKLSVVRLDTPQSWPVYTGIVVLTADGAKLIVLAQTHYIEFLMLNVVFKMNGNFT